jgi:hypothetical protein
LSSTAAATAATTAPPAPRIETAANWADPAKVVIDITTGASDPIPAERASTPNEAPKTTTAAANGSAARAPSR